MKAVGRLGSEPVERGKPLYKYRIDLKQLEVMEAFINNPRASDTQKILALAPVAAANFAMNYVDGLPAWEDCGAEVSKLYGTTQASQQRFRMLMERSLGYYGVNIAKRADGATLLLETIIGQAGLPPGMLKEGQPLWKILDALMKRVGEGAEDAKAEASLLVDDAVERADGRQVPRLRRAYRDAQHLPQLCSDLVLALSQLVERANWTGGSLEPIYDLPNWDKDLPFRVDEATARILVSQLLNVAMTAAGRPGLAIERILSRQYGQYILETRASISPEGILLPDENRPVVAVHYAVDGEPADEAFRLRGTENSPYFLAKEGHALGDSANTRQVSLVLKKADGYLPLDCAGQEPLDESVSWVFESRGHDDIYRTPAPARLRARKLRVVAPEGTRVSGAAAQLSRLPPSRYGAARTIWEVTGEATFIGEDGEPAQVQAGYEGPQMYLDFRGRAPNFKVKEFSTVFLGHPEPRRSGGLSGRIQWKKAGTTEWSSATLRGQAGHLSFRLVAANNEVLAERRRVFVFPEDFNPKITPKSVSFKLPSGCELREHVADAEGNLTLEFASSQMQVAMIVAGVPVEIVFARPPAAAAFIDTTSQEQISNGTKEISSLVAGRIRAYSTHHDAVEIRRVSDRFDAIYPARLQGAMLRLSELKDFLQALSFHPRGRTHAISVQFRNGPAIKITPHRIRRRGNMLTIAGAGDDTRIQLLPLNAPAQCQKDSIALERVDAEQWKLPEPIDETAQYLAIDATHQATPCLVAAAEPEEENARTFLGVIGISDESAREQALVALYEWITENPHEGRAAAELKTCLQWLGTFQRWLSWLDPFLILAAYPPLALRVLSLSRLDGETLAEQGLRTALNEVPFFWHRVTPTQIVALIDWVTKQFGPESAERVNRLLDELDIPRMMKQPAQLRPALPPWRDAWQAKVIEWASSQQEHQLRSPRQADASMVLWKHLEGHPDEDELRSRPKNIPADVDIFRTWLLAPHELAIAIAHDIPLEDQLRDDLLFARHMIDAEEFDLAYCASLARLETI